MSEGLQSGLIGIAFLPSCGCCSWSQDTLAHPELSERPELLLSNSSHSLGRRWDISAFIPVLLWLQNTIKQIENGPGQDLHPKLSILLVLKKTHQNPQFSQPESVVCTGMSEAPLERSFRKTSFLGCFTKTQIATRYGTVPWFYWHLTRCDDELYGSNWLGHSKQIFG